MKPAIFFKAAAAAAFLHGAASLAPGAESKSSNDVIAGEMRFAQCLQALRATAKSPKDDVSIPTEYGRLTCTVVKDLETCGFFFERADGGPDFGRIIIGKNGIGAVTQRDPLVSVQQLLRISVFDTNNGDKAFQETALSPAHKGLLGALRRAHSACQEPVPTV